MKGPKAGEGSTTVKEAKLNAGRLRYGDLARAHCARAKSPYRKRPAFSFASLTVVDPSPALGPFMVRKYRLSGYLIRLWNCPTQAKRGLEWGTQRLSNQAVELFKKTQPALHASFQAANGQLRVLIRADQAVALPSANHDPTHPEVPAQPLKVSRLKRRP